MQASLDPREYGILCEAISVLAAEASTDMWRAELADMTMTISRNWVILDPSVSTSRGNELVALTAANHARTPASR
jgi:hypothetical protein